MLQGWCRVLGLEHAVRMGTLNPVFRNFDINSPEFGHCLKRTCCASCLHSGGCRTLLAVLAAPPSRSRLSGEKAVINLGVCWLGGLAWVVWSLALA